MAVQHAADIINHDQHADDLHRLKAQVAEHHDDDDPVSMHDVVNLLWKRSTKNGKKIKQKDYKGKQKVYNKLLNSRAGNADFEYSDRVNGIDTHIGFDEYNVDSRQNMNQMESWMGLFADSEDTKAVHSETAENHMLWALLGFNIDIIVLISCLAVLLCKVLCGLGVFKVTKT